MISLAVAVLALCSTLVVVAGLVKNSTDLTGADEIAAEDVVRLENLIDLVGCFVTSSGAVLVCVGYASVWSSGARPFTGVAYLAAGIFCAKLATVVPVRASYWVRSIKSQEKLIGLYERRLTKITGVGGVVPTHGPAGGRRSRAAVLSAYLIGPLTAGIAPGLIFALPIALRAGAPIGAAIQLSSGMGAAAVLLTFFPLLAALFFAPTLWISNKDLAIVCCLAPVLTGTIFAMACLSFIQVDTRNLLAEAYCRTVGASGVMSALLLTAYARFLSVRSVPWRRMQARRVEKVLEASRKNLQKCHAYLLARTYSPPE